MTTETPAAPKARSKSKTPLIIAALVIVAVLAIIAGRSASGDAYETFSLAMNKIAGEGKWTAGSHSASLFSGLLTVDDLKVDLPENGALTIASLALGGALAKGDLADLIEAGAWRGAKELKIADKLNLTGIKITNAELKLNYDLAELSLESPALAPAAQGGELSGPVSFLKAFKADSLVYKNFSGAAALPEDNGQMEFGAGEVRAVGFSFAGKPIAAFDSLDPSGLLSSLSAFVAKEYGVKNMFINLSGEFEGNAPTKIAISLDEALSKNEALLRSSDSSVLRGFKVEVESEELKAVGALAEMTTAKLDADAYVDKLSTVMAAAVKSSDANQMESALSDLQTLGDLFVSPIGFDDMTMKGLEINLSDLISFKLAEASVVGPFKAGQMPVSQKNSLKGLEVKLSENPDNPRDEGRAIYDFGRDFGLTVFRANGESEGSYDAASGLFAIRANNFKVDDLAEFSAEIQFDGLTPGRLEVFNNTPLNNPLAFILNPEAIFGEASFNGFSLKVKDLGLRERLYQYISRTDDSFDGPEDVKNQATAALAALENQSAGSLNNPADLRQPLTIFLENGGGLEVKIKADPPLSVQSVQNMGADPNRILNSLGITFVADDKAFAPLNFAADPPAGDLSSMTDEEMEQLLKEMEALDEEEAE
ncbi:MAG: hypothetical protein LBS31_00645 [Candidatus Adiutrix sp.]|jgi:hypothetical protein|nr:hypothetical protein [Candidatus Adiutrix sp.]